MIDHSSPSRFSTGVPVRATRPSAGGLLGGAVLDRLGLVADDPRPANASEQAAVAGSRPVRGDHQVGCGGRGREIVAAAAVRTVVDVRAQARREALRFPAPIADERHGCDHERGRWSTVSGSLAGQQGQDLNRLPQAHVVGEDGAQPESVEEAEPGKAPLLVRTQSRNEAVRGRDGGEPLIGLAG
jgi:hypothetical protein